MVAPVVLRRMAERRSAIAVGYVFALLGTVFGSWAARLADVKERIDASPGPLGAAMLCTAIGSLTSMAVAPRLIRRFGVRRVAMTGATGCCVGVTVAASAPSLGVLAASLLVLGMCSGATSIGLGMQAVAFERRANRPIVNRFHGCHSAGGLVGALAGAAASTWLNPTVHLIAIAAAGLAGLVVVRSWFPTGDVSAAVASGSTAVVNRRFLAASSLAWCAAFGEGTVVAWAAVHLREELGAPPALAAFGFAAMAAVIVTARAVGPAVLGRWPARTVLSRSGWLARGDP